MCEAYNTELSAVDFQFYSLMYAGYQGGQDAKGMFTKFSMSHPCITWLMLCLPDEKCLIFILCNLTSMVRISFSPRHKDMVNLNSKPFLKPREKQIASTCPHRHECEFQYKTPDD